MTVSDDVAELRTEIEELRKSIAKLSDDVKSSSRTTRASSRADDGDDDDDTSDFGYLTDRKMDEASRFLRGMVHASLESVRVVADSLSGFVEEVVERNVPRENESVSDVARRLPADVGRGIVRGIDDKLNIPGRAIDRFEEIYRDPKQSGRGTQRRTRTLRRGTQRSSRAEPSRAERSRPERGSGASEEKQAS